MSFDKDIANFTNKTEEAATKIFRGTALSLLGKIIKRTPVDTGRLRGNWFSSINAPIKKVDGSSEGYSSTVAKAKLGNTIFFVNNLPYAQVIEHGDYSEQAPNGMVKVTVAEFESVVKANARKHKV